MWSEERKEGTTKQAIDFEQNGSVAAFFGCEENEFIC